MRNRAEAVIDLNAVAANVQKLKNISGTELMAVVKADAYGHGLLPVAKTAISAGATWLGVALAEEAHSLRAAGITAPLPATGAPARSLPCRDWGQWRGRRLCASGLRGVFADLLGLVALDGALLQVALLGLACSPVAGAYTDAGECYHHDGT
jgi:hypothetical protein